MKLLSLITTIFLISNTVSALGACTTFTTTPSLGTVTVGSPVTLGATVSGCGSPVGEVDFYNGATELCQAINPATSGLWPNTTYTFSCSWTSNVPPASSLPLTFNLSAVALASGGSTPIGVFPNMAIDMVGTISNPASDQSFGEQSFNGNGETSWLEGDNQFCSVNWPYNGYNLAYPDGSCEWTNTVTFSNTPSLNPTTETIDGLDDTMHTLSDFVKFSNSLLNLSGGSLISTFNNWYSQAAEWIAPACTGATACTSNAFDQLSCPSVVTCNQGSNGRLLNIYNPPPPGSTTPQTDLFNNWNANLITPWLNNSYTNSGAWCVPPESKISGTTEDAYITNNSAKLTCAGNTACPNTGVCPDGSTCSHWGDLPHVIACLNYNAAPVSAGAGNSAAYAYQNCLNQLPQTGSCPATQPAACAAATLGRSFVACADGSTCGAITTGECSNGSACGYMPAYLYSSGSGNCSASTLSYVKWVKDSLTLFTDEAPKFALRGAFLGDLYKRATTMQNIFTQADSALAGFFKTCYGCAKGACSSPVGAGTCSDGSVCNASNCTAGGPVAQLMWARDQLQGTSDPLRVLPNAVIYGWQDNQFPNGKTGYAHIVKVTAFSPGRGGALQTGDFIHPLLPWINTWTTFFERKFALADRDGYVYVDIKRWDEDHSGVLTFPNNHTLWQFLFHSPGSFPSITGSGLIGTCNGLTVGTSSVGYGLLPQTVQGLNYVMNTVRPFGANKDTTTLTALGNAFMLNDEGDGAIDPSLTVNGTVGQACPNGSQYCSCLSQANTLLNYGVESRACAEYIASGHNAGSIASGSSGNGDSDYSLKFVDCKNLPYVQDLGGS